MPGGNKRSYVLKHAAFSPDLLLPSGMKKLRIIFRIGPSGSLTDSSNTSIQYIRLFEQMPRLELNHLLTCNSYLPIDWSMTVCDI